MLKIKKGTLSIGDTFNRIGQITKTIKSSNRVMEAHIALNGFTANYAGDDHHVKLLQVELEANIGSSSTTQNLKDRVHITAKLWLRDKNADDTFNGEVGYVLFLRLGGPVVPPTR
jgi:hypothetical protein